MRETKDDFSSLKRNTYLVVLPFILISSLLTFFVRLSNGHYGFEFYINTLFVVTFISGWFAAYFNYWRKFFELLILALLLIYYCFSVFLTIQGNVTHEQYLGNEMFMIWLPLLLMYIFAVFKRRKAISLSIALFIFSIFPFVFYFADLHGYFREMFFQLYIATIVYIIIIIYAFKLFESYLEHQFLAKQFYLDALTQIGNRYQINEWMAQYLNQEDEAPVSVIFFDIDHFKAINDHYGHITGDNVLKEVTWLIRSETSAYPHFGRWGGEEFILFARIPECEAFTLAERLREVLEAHHFEEVSQVTASFGVTSYRADDTVQSLLERVDKKLYESKRQGRNRVTGKFDK